MNTTEPTERPVLRGTACDICGRPSDPFEAGRLCMASIQHPDGTRTLCNGTIRPVQEREFSEARP